MSTQDIDATEKEALASFAGSILPSSNEERFCFDGPIEGQRVVFILSPKQLNGSMKQFIPLTFPNDLDQSTQSKSAKREVIDNSCFLDYSEEGKIKDVLERTQVPIIVAIVKEVKNCDGDEEFEQKFGLSKGRVVLPGAITNIIYYHQKQKEVGGVSFY